MKLAELSKHPIRTRVSLTGPMIVARDAAHAKIRERLDRGEPMPDYFRNHPVYYAGPAKTPSGYASGSFGPTTAGRMDAYVDQFQAAGGSMLMLAKGNWQGEQLIPAAYVERATSPLSLSYGKSFYGFFWWVEDFQVAGKAWRCVEGRGAGGQFIFMFPDLDLVAVITAHHKGLGMMLATAPNRLVPAFLAQGVNPPAKEIQK